MYCTKCGTQHEANFCPNCGTPASGVPVNQNAGTPVTPQGSNMNKPNKPFYKKVWFWIIAVIVLAAALKGLSGGSDDKQPVDANATNRPAGQQTDAVTKTKPPVKTIIPTSTPIPTPTPEPFKPLIYNGSGDDVVQIEAPVGVYTISFTHEGSRNFVVWDYDEVGSKELLVNDIGDWSGALPFWGGAHNLEISADGDWTVVVDQMAQVFSLESAGTGCSCVGYYIASSGDSGSYSMTHSGEGNFVIWAYTSERTDLVVNEIGTYEGTKFLQFDDGEVVVFGITADGDWSISKD